MRGEGGIGECCEKVSVICCVVVVSRVYRLVSLHSHTFCDLASMESAEIC